MSFKISPCNLKTGESVRSGMRQHNRRVRVTEMPFIPSVRKRKRQSVVRKSGCLLYDIIFAVIIVGAVETELDMMSSSSFFTGVFLGSSGCDVLKNEIKSRFYGFIVQLVKYDTCNVESPVRVWVKPQRKMQTPSGKLASFCV